MDFKKEENKVVTLTETIHKLVQDSCSITFGGFCGRNSQAVAYEIIRQKKKDITIIDDSPTDAVDLLIGAGCVKRLEIAWHGISGFARAANFRRAMDDQIPCRIEVEDYSNYAVALRFLAGAMNVPFLPTRSLIGSDLPKYNEKIKIIVDPYHSEPIALVPAATPDVALIHVQRADKHGNAQIWGHLANDENKARAARHTIITCEEIVPEDAITRIPNMTAIPSYCVDAVIKVPYGSHPWSCYGYYYHDVIFQRDYTKCNENRENFLKWLNEWVLNCEDHLKYCAKIGKGRLSKLAEIEKSWNNIPV